ncbi:hypothetical protein ACLOJK_041628 [Asimina triloba]
MRSHQRPDSASATTVCRQRQQSPPSFDAISSHPRLYSSVVGVCPSPPPSVSSLSVPRSIRPTASTIQAICIIVFIDRLSTSRDPPSSSSPSMSLVCPPRFVNIERLQICFLISENPSRPLADSNPSAHRPICPSTAPGSAPDLSACTTSRARSVRSRENPSRMIPTTTSSAVDRPATDPTGSRPIAAAGRRRRPSLPDMKKEEDDGKVKTHLQRSKEIRRRCPPLAIRQSLSVARRPPLHCRPADFFLLGKKVEHHITQYTLFGAPSVPYLFWYFLICHITSRHDMMNFNSGPHIMGPTSVSQSMTLAMGPTSVSQSIDDINSGSHISQSVDDISNGLHISQSVDDISSGPHISQSVDDISNEPHISQTVGDISSGPHISQSVGDINSGPHISQSVDCISNGPHISQSVDDISSGPHISQSVDDISNGPHISQSVDGISSESHIS